MNIIKHKATLITVSLALILVSAFLLVTRGLNIGIEFTGGSVIEVSYATSPSVDEVNLALSGTGLDVETQIQPFGDNGYIIRTRDLSDDERIVIRDSILSLGEGGEIERFNSIGPSLGNELKKKALLAMFIVIGAIILFVAYAFRGVAKAKEEDEHVTVSSWQYGIAAVLALIHDVIIPIGIFALLGLEVDSLFIVGVLSILGLSVNDTIVVFDRIRENLQENVKENNKEDFEVTVNRSVNQTITRSINTSLTLLVVLIALLLLGPDATVNLAFVMILGTIAGTYSSIFFASPVLVWWNERITKKTNQEQ